MKVLHRHPGLRTGSELTRGERAADRMRNGMGSWAFVFGALMFLAVWMGINIAITRSGKHAFDGYPFILLNLVLSCVAALQGAILLIAAKRSDQVSSELAQHDYNTDLEAKEILDVLKADMAELRAEHQQVVETLTAQGANLRYQTSALVTLINRFTPPLPPPASAMVPASPPGDSGPSSQGAVLTKTGGKE